MDEQHRRFYSGRFGPSPLDVDYNTKIEGAKGVTTREATPAKKEEPKQSHHLTPDQSNEIKEVPKDIPTPETQQGPEMTKSISDIVNKYKGQ